jgi:hypothetical protein
MLAAKAYRVRERERERQTERVRERERERERARERARERKRAYIDAYVHIHLHMCLHQRRAVVHENIDATCDCPSRHEKGGLSRTNLSTEKSKTFVRLLSFKGHRLTKHRLTNHGGMFCKCWIRNALHGTMHTCISTQSSSMHTHMCIYAT